MSGLDYNLSWLQALYDHFAVDDWHEDRGCRIDTLDNPGWSFKFDLPGTKLATASFDPIETHRSEHDWFLCRVQEQSFEGFCGPRNLNEILSVFRRWVEDQGIASSMIAGAVQR